MWARSLAETESMLLGEKAEPKAVKAAAVSVLFSYCCFLSIGIGMFLLGLFIGWIERLPQEEEHVFGIPVRKWKKHGLNIR